MITQNNLVSINYEVRDTDTNEIIDSNMDKKPLDFIVGLGQIIDGLEEKIVGASVGDKLNFIVEPEKAYGLRQPELIQEVSKSQFGDIDLKKGMSLFGQAENGTPVQVIVTDFNDEVVMIDYNHPLAGKSLQFDVLVLDARMATDEEIKSGGPINSGSGESGGGCGCGGCGCH